MRVRRVKPVWLLVFIVNLTGCRITIETALGVTVQMFLERFLIWVTLFYWFGFSTEYKQESIMSTSVCNPLLLVSG